MIWLLQKLADVLAPEEARLSKMLALEPSILGSLLPKSNLHQKDLLAIFDYQNKMVRLLVKAVKFKNNPQAKKVLATFIYEEAVGIATDLSLFYGSSPILIPIPMSRDEERSRGWNQCEELAKKLATFPESQIPIHLNLLQKIRNTERQVGLSRKERLKNVKNCMQVSDPKNILKDRVVIVLDDIHTTGSTFEEARRALLASGTKKVVGLFLAH